MINQYQFSINSQKLTTSHRGDSPCLRHFLGAELAQGHMGSAALDDGQLHENPQYFQVHRLFQVDLAQLLLTSQKRGFWAAETDQS